MWALFVLLLLLATCKAGLIVYYPALNHERPLALLLTLNAGKGELTYALSSLIIFLNIMGRNKNAKRANFSTRKIGHSSCLTWRLNEGPPFK